MGSNSLLTDAKITKRAMAVLHNELGFIKGVNREYSKEFAQTGAKIGNTINVRKPNRYTTGQGGPITPQATTEGFVPLTLNRQWHVPMSFSSAELALSIDEFEARYIQPAIKKLASDIDLDCMYAAVTGSYLFTNPISGVACPGAGPVNFVIGTPGTTPGTGGGSASGLLQYNAPGIFLNAGRVLSNQAAPRDKNRTCALNPDAQAASVGALAGLQNPQGLISEQYRSGLITNALGFDFVEDQNMPSYTSGTQTGIGTVTLVNNTATCSSASATVATGTLTPGTSFTVAGVYAVNPENQQPLTYLQQFVVTALNTASGSAHSSLAISPTPKLAGSGIADGNCWTASGAFSAQAGTITSGATASTVYAQNLAFHKDAFTFGTADLELPSDVSFKGRETLDGISMRILRQYGGMSDTTVCRIDVLGGFSVLRPEWALRITG
jgi:hypothetical protein